MADTRFEPAADGSLTRFPISRAIWLRGEQAWTESNEQEINISALYRTSDGLACCVGQFAMACGLTREECANHGPLGALCFQLPTRIQQILRSIKPPVDHFLSNPSPDWFLANLYTSNDRRDRTETEREHEIMMGFKQLGFEAYFTE